MRTTCCKLNRFRASFCFAVLDDVSSVLGSKMHQRATETIQQNLETEARLKMEAVVVRKRLEQDITELEITLEGVNKARAETEKTLKQCQQEVGDLETLLEEEQKSKFDSLFLIR